MWSKCDSANGEPACDEAAPHQPGDAERIPCAQGRRASTALLSTSTTDGKRHLKDRILCTVQNRRTVTTALFAVIALTAGVCAATFTGGKTTPQAQEPRPLTGEELAYFNESFFNQDDGACMPNEFLSVLFASPEEIDVFALFFNGLGMTDQVPSAERQQLELHAGSRSNQFWGCRKITAADLDALLEEYTGRTAADMAPESLESFVYLPEQDAYYTFYPLEEAPSWITTRFSAGEREGSLIHLYYQDFSFGGYGTKCVTLEEQSDGSHWFVSHLLAENTAIPTVYPEGEPVLTIPLTDLTAYVPALSARRLDSLPDNVSAVWDAYGTTRRLCRLEDGKLHVVLEHTPPSGGTGIYWDVFAFPEDVDTDRITLSDAYGLLGHDCVVVSYRGYVDLPDSRLNDWINDYYSFDGDGNPILLARAYGETTQIDLDGDGENELCASSPNTAQIFFRREDHLYEADVDHALENAWPEAEYLDYNWWDMSRRRLDLWGSVPFAGHEDTGAAGTAWRTLYFDGENLLLYKDTTTYTDHAADSIDVPEAVLSAARDRVLYYSTQFQGMAWDENYEAIDASPEWDDWRITALELVDEAPAYPELGIKVYRLGFELHTPIPERVMPAGGTYIGEDGWVGGMYVESPYLVFHTMTSSGPTLLESDIPTDVGNSSGSPMFAACLAQTLLQNDLLTPSQVRDADLYYMFYNNQSAFLNLMGAYDAQEQSRAMQALTAYAVSVADTSDGDLLDHGLQNLAWNSSALSEAGRGAYARLLAAVEQQETRDA